MKESRDVILCLSVTVKIYLSSENRPVDPADARVSVFDRGFLYGDSVYETIRTAGGVAVELRRHLERLHHSAEGIGLEIPFRDEKICDAMTETLLAAQNQDSRIRIVVTRGTGPMQLDTRVSEEPLLVIYVQPLVVPTQAAYTRGLSAMIMVPRTHAHPGLKTGNYLPNILALRQAIARSGDDAIMCNNSGEITEGATSNIFCLSKGTVYTPPLDAGLLAGITRLAVIELTRECGIPFEETTISPDFLRSADEVFFTSSVRGIMPVTQIDGSLVAEGGVGPVTQQLLDAYAQYLVDWASGKRQ